MREQRGKRTEDRPSLAPERRSRPRPAACELAGRRPRGRCTLRFPRDVSPGDPASGAAPGRLDEPDVQSALRLVGRRRARARDSLRSRCSCSRRRSCGPSGESAGAPQSTGSGGPGTSPERRSARCSCSGRFRLFRVFTRRRPGAGDRRRRAIEAHAGSPIGGLATHFSLVRG